MVTRHEEDSSKKKYKIKIESGNEVLTYNATELILDGNFASFKDKFGNRLMVNLSKVISIGEVDDEH